MALIREKGLAFKGQSYVLIEWVKMLYEHGPSLSFYKEKYVQSYTKKDMMPHLLKVYLTLWFLRVVSRGLKKNLNNPCGGHTTFLKLSTAIID